MPLPAGRLIRGSSRLDEFPCSSQIILTNVMCVRFYFYRRPFQSIKQPLGGRRGKRTRETRRTTVRSEEKNKKDARHMAARPSNETVGIGEGYGNKDPLVRLCPALDQVNKKEEEKNITSKK